MPPMYAHFGYHFNLQELYSNNFNINIMYMELFLLPSTSQVKGETQPKDALKNAANENGMTHEKGSEITDYGIPLLELAESSRRPSVKVRSST